MNNVASNTRNERRRVKDMLRFLLASMGTAVTFAWASSCTDGLGLILMIIYLLGMVNDMTRGMCHVCVEVVLACCVCVASEVNWKMNTDVTVLMAYSLMYLLMSNFVVSAYSLMFLLMSNFVVCVFASHLVWEVRRVMVAVEQEFTLKRFGKLRRKCVNAILDFMSDFSVNLYVGSSGGGRKRGGGRGRARGVRGNGARGGGARGVRGGGRDGGQRRKPQQSNNGNGKGNDDRDRKREKADQQGKKRVKRTKTPSRIRTTRLAGEHFGDNALVFEVPEECTTFLDGEKVVKEVRGAAKKVTGCTSASFTQSGSKNVKLKDFGVANLKWWIKNGKNVARVILALRSFSEVSNAFATILYDGEEKKGGANEERSGISPHADRPNLVACLTGFFSFGFKRDLIIALTSTKHFGVKTENLEKKILNFCRFEKKKFDRDVIHARRSRHGNARNTKTKE